MLTGLGIVVGCGAVGMGVGAFAASIMGVTRAYLSRPVLSDGHDIPCSVDKTPSEVMGESVGEVAEEVVVVPYAADVGGVREDTGAKAGERRVYGAVFDLDGTLVESVEIWFALLNAAAKEFGMDAISREEYFGVDGEGGHFGQPMEDNLALWFVGADPDAVCTYCDDHYIDYVEDHLVLLPGAKEAVQSAVDLFGPRVGLATNCPSKITHLILKTTGLDAFFPLVVCAGDPIPDSSAQVKVLLSPRHHDQERSPGFPSQAQGGEGGVPVSEEPASKLRSKPETDILDYSAAQLGLDTSELVFVGDSRFDVVAGLAANCVVIGIGVDGGFVRVASIVQAHAWWDSLSKIGS